MIKLNFSSEFLCFCSNLVIFVVDGRGCRRCTRLAVILIRELALVDLQFLEEERLPEGLHVLGDEVDAHLGKGAPDLESDVEERESGGASKDVEGLELEILRFWPFDDVRVGAW